MTNSQYNKVTYKAVIELAAPHTWPASIVPVVLGAVLSCSLERKFEPVLFLLVLVIAILLQSAVNTINDYADFIKGTDTEENSDDPNDASIVYNKINPKHALYIGILFIAAAALAGIYVILETGIVPLIFGAVGVAVIVFYSSGKKPISYLPLGELVSGGVMGWLITFASYYVHSGRINLSLIYYALPTVITIGLIMMTNNTSDIERDSMSGRKTLPVLLGRKRAAALLKALAAFAALLAFFIVLVSFNRGAFLIPLMLIGLSKPGLSLLRSPVTPNVRMASMGSILGIHNLINWYYIAAIAADLIRGAL
jgi:1,4-dihydroxy-2-naphthoate octaprenyltransferase